jgi:hypothetical protein
MGDGGQVAAVVRTSSTRQDTRARLQVLVARARWPINRLAEIGRRIDQALAMRDQHLVTSP